MHHMVKQVLLDYKLVLLSAGRLFSRKLDPFDPEDNNVILDDISLDFTGVAGTQFDSYRKT